MGYNKNYEQDSFIYKNAKKCLTLTQEKFAERSDLGLRFIRGLEHAKDTLRMDNAMLGMEAVPGRKWGD